MTHHYDEGSNLGHTQASSAPNRLSNPIPTPTRDNAREALDDTLHERGAKYGEFRHQAMIAQTLKNVMREYGLSRMQPMQIEALEMIQHKIARILNGDPNYADSWIDIAGYAKLVADRLESK